MACPLGQYRFFCPGSPYCLPDRGSSGIPHTVSAPITLVSGKVPVTVSLPSGQKLGASSRSRMATWSLKDKFWHTTKREPAASQYQKAKLPVRQNAIPLQPPASGRVLLFAAVAGTRQSPLGQLLVSVIVRSRQ